MTTLLPDSRLYPTKISRNNHQEKYMSELIVEFLEDLWEVPPDEEMIFGREGDLSIDENPYLHRHLGSFVHRNGLWWLRNIGSAIAMELRDCKSPAVVVLPPDVEAPIAYDRFTIRFEAGATPYELSGTLAEPTGSGVSHVLPGTGTETEEFGRVAMTLDQRLLVLALAEPRLRDMHNPDVPLPSNREAAQRLGWKITKFNRKLDNVCDKLTKKGVPGLHGDRGGIASNRRKHLVDHAVNSGMVSPADLQVFDDL